MRHRGGAAAPFFSGLGRFANFRLHQEGNVPCEFAKRPGENREHLHHLSKVVTLRVPGQLRFPQIEDARQLSRDRATSRSQRRQRAHRTPELKHQRPLGCGTDTIPIPAQRGERARQLQAKCRRGPRLQPRPAQKQGVPMRPHLNYQGAVQVLDRLIEQLYAFAHLKHQRRIENVLTGRAQMNGARRALTSALHLGSQLPDKRDGDIPRVFRFPLNGLHANETRVEQRFQRRARTGLGDAVPLERAHESPFEPHHGAELLFLRENARHLRRREEKRVQAVAHWANAAFYHSKNTVSSWP